MSKIYEYSLFTSGLKCESEVMKREEFFLRSGITDRKFYQYIELNDYKILYRGKYITFNKKYIENYSGLLRRSIKFFKDIYCVIDNEIDKIVGFEFIEDNKIKDYEVLSALRCINKFNPKKAELISFELYNTILELAKGGVHYNQLKNVSKLYEEYYDKLSVNQFREIESYLSVISIFLENYEDFYE